MGRTMTVEAKAKRASAIELYKSGQTRAEIAKTLDVPRRTLGYWLGPSIVAQCAHQDDGGGQDGQQFYTLKELAAASGRGRTDIWRERRDGNLPTSRRNGRLVVSAADAERLWWRRKRPRPSKPPPELRKKQRAAHRLELRIARGEEP